MKFNSFTYIALLAITLILFYNVRHRARLLLLIGTSLIFYSFWSVPFLSLIVISAIIDFTAGQRIHRSNTTLGRRGWLTASMVTNLGLLGFFKYANFFAENVQAVFGDTTESRILNIILPPGISFYTFQTMSYTIDVYRRSITPTNSFLRFFLYVSFFPQLVAGPIERAAHLLTQFDYAATQRFSMANLTEGSRMIIWGLFKKVVIADSCAIIADQVYSDHTGYGGFSALVATYAFTLQIYCDFSAYSEIARGSARLFGIDLMQNFDQPYLAGNIQDFWRRWHISLSNWFRDYVYVPLGGSRHGRTRTLTNLVLTMFLSGLWHGAAWTFVAWGLFHGLFLLIHSQFVARPSYKKLSFGGGAAWQFLGWFTTLNIVAAGWILFRADTFQDAWDIFQQIATLPLHSSSQLFSNPVEWGFMVFLTVFMLSSYLGRRFKLLESINLDSGLSIIFYSLLLLIMCFLARADGPQFIYFQF